MKYLDTAADDMRSSNKRAITIFDKHTEHLVQYVEIEIPDDELPKFLVTLGVDKKKDPNMILCYDITEEHIPLISQFTDMKFDFDRFLYSIETYSEKK